MLRLDLAKTVERRNEYMADADNGVVEISQLRGEIMTLLTKMSIEKPQRPVQENEVFLSDTPFVVVLLDGSASMVWSHSYSNDTSLTDPYSLKMDMFKKEREEVGKQ